jgi:hypothetical protein
MSKNTDPNHAHKKAKDAFGGDPLAPTDAMLERIAAAIKAGKKDDSVTLWAKAFQAICPEPNTPKRTLLGKLAAAVLDPKDAKDEEVKAWAGGAQPTAPKSAHNLDHMV